MPRSRELPSRMATAGTSLAIPTAAPAAVILPDAVWITWENQRRNHGIANALSVPLSVFDIKGSRIARYLKALWLTGKVIAERKPKIVFVQNPSIVLAFAAVTVGRWAGITVVVDAHNAAIIPLQSPSRSMLWRVARYIVRQARLTIVTNASLAKVVDAAGGRGFVLPDRIPELPAPAAATPRLPKGSVLFICSFASDEPFTEVIAAARSLDPAVRVYITGNPRHRLAELKAQSPPNVVFTGFVPEDEYIAMLHSADVIVDLTSRDDCLVCGAYEGVAAERPLILSGSAAIRAYFSQGVRYTDNTSHDLADAVREALADGDKMRAELRQLKSRLTREWNRQRMELVALLTDRNGLQS